MREIIIKENDANQRIDKFLLKSLNNLPKNLMYKYIRNKKIKVNGKRCEISTRLNAGDIITCYIAEEFFEVEKDDTFKKAKGKLDIVYEDNNIIVMNKPIGLLCQSDINEDNETLVNQMKKYLYQKNEFDYLNEQSFTPSLCHRLDRNTSGLVIGAKNASSLRYINYLIKNRLIEKHYLTICLNKINKEGTFIDYHKKENQQIYIKSEMSEGYKEIKTSFQLIDFHNGYSLVDVDLLTGKAHQIRAQFAFHKFPLLGDFKYGEKSKIKDYQTLCAYKLIFHNNEDNEFLYLKDKIIELENNTIKELFYSL